MDTAIEKKEDPIVHIGSRTNKVLEAEAKRWKVSKKEFVEFCVKFCVDLDIDPTNYNSTKNRNLAKKINTSQMLKAMEKNLTDRILESRNTYVSFVKQMESEQLKSINNKLEALQERLKLETGSLAINQVKGTLLIVDLCTNLLIEDRQARKNVFDSYLKQLNAH